MTEQTSQGLYIALISVHGLIRWNDLELGRDADTGGQILYVVELAQALAELPNVDRVDLVTRQVIDPAVSPDYAKAEDCVNDRLRITRIEAGPPEYIAKEQLWDHLDTFVDNAVHYFRSTSRIPDIIHSHYADAGYVGSKLAQLLAVPLVHTGHSLGRVKRRRLLATGLSRAQIESTYNIARRIEAEELTLATAERVITSTHQEIEEQYELYDHYQPEQMRVLPPGTDLTRFVPPEGDETNSLLYHTLVKYLTQPNKPIILALSRPDKRKNMVALIEAFGRSETLQNLANLIIIAGNRDDIDDLEEGAQEVFHEMLVAIDRYDLYGKVALPKHHQRDQVPLMYRMVASSKGVFVNPALTEPFGLTIIEAAASGLPVVATEDGGPRDIIANCQNGFLVNPLETDSIAQALVNLLTDSELWQQCSENGLKGVRKFYSWQAHANKYYKIVKPIADRSEKHEPVLLQRRDKLFQDRAVFSDLDQNLLGRTAAVPQLLALLKSHRRSTKFGIATGRRLDSALKVMKKYAIPVPDILITSSGTEIYYAPKLSQDSAWRKHIDYQWSPHRIREVLADLPGLKRQPKIEQSRFKVSFYFNPELAPSIEEINSLLHQEELSVHVQVSFGQFLDVLPLRASKGHALRYVADRLGLPLERIFVAGGSGADEDMMRGNTLAAVVANRHHEELSQLINVERIYFSEKPFADGIIESLEYYDFFASCRDPREKIKEYES